jgi:hypothetical protein
VHQSGNHETGTFNFFLLDLKKMAAGDGFALFMSVTVFALFAVILYLLMERPAAPIRQVIVAERPVVRWKPWSWGAGGYNGPGTTIVHRPVPHFA